LFERVFQADQPKKAAVHRVPADVPAARLDRYLDDALGLSRARLMEAFERSAVRVNGRRARKGDTSRELFAARKVGKRYLALVGGAPGEGGTIDLPIAHHPKNPRRMLACAMEEDAAKLKARPALTLYRALERLGDFTLVEVQIPTGVMHQIRVHLSAVGAPVAGDELYGGPAIAGLTRQFLHASRIEFPHPLGGPPALAESPMPAELEEVLARLRGH
jgi:23S rRNA pseudouridine1911/1915/1917 synthase